jgi:dihydroorotate dehydrogenase (NAD+) catalytic subunit
LSPSVPASHGARLCIVGEPMADLSARVGAISFATPVIAASGTYGYGVEYDGLVDWSLVGGVSVKGLSLHPSKGHAAPRMSETAAGMLNAIGLQNIGVDLFVAEKLPRLRQTGTRVIVNCWGNTLAEYEAVVEKLDSVPGIDALELNLSSPNKREWPRLPSSDPDITSQIVSACRKRTRLPMWVKLTPNVGDIVVIAKAATDAGADALTLINTLRGMAIDIRARAPLLSNVTGGLSGPAIKPVALFMVYEVARSISIPVVGVGGICCGQDAVEFLMAGASAVQVGTACLYDPAAPARISREIGGLLDELGAGSVGAVVGAARGR